MYDPQEQQPAQMHFDQKNYMKNVNSYSMYMMQQYNQFGLDKMQQHQQHQYEAAVHQQSAAAALAASIAAHAANLMQTDLSKGVALITHRPASAGNGNGGYHPHPQLHPTNRRYAPYTCPSRPATLQQQHQLHRHQMQALPHPLFSYSSYQQHPLHPSPLANAAPLPQPAAQLTAANNSTRSRTPSRAGTVSPYSLTTRSNRSTTPSAATAAASNTCRTVATARQVAAASSSSSPHVAAGEAAGNNGATTIGNLFPEILTMIMERLDVPDRGRAAQVCTAWRDAVYPKVVWRGVEAKLHLRKSQSHVYPSLVRRGIRHVQVLSMKRSIRDLCQMQCLQVLNLSGCFNLTDAALSAAFQAECPNLRTMNLSLCKQISDTGLGKVAQNVQQLQVLELGGCCNITNNGMLLIAWGLRKLRRLNLRSCWLVSDTGIGHLAGRTPEAVGTMQLEWLGLQDLPSMTDASLKHVADGLHELRSINLSFGVSVTDTGLKHLARMAQLEELNLGSCDNITDIGIAYLTDGGAALRSLDISFVDKISDTALGHIGQRLPELRSLSLNHCQISDDGLLRLAKGLPQLETLNIGQCDRITDAGLEAATAEASQLTAIDLYGCTGLTKPGLDTVMKNPKLKHLNLGLWMVR